MDAALQWEAWSAAAAAATRLSAGGSGCAGLTGSLDHPRALTWLFWANQPITQPTARQMPRPSHGLSIVPSRRSRSSVRGQATGAGSPIVNDGHCDGRSSCSTSHFWLERSTQLTVAACSLPRLPADLGEVLCALPCSHAPALWQRRRGAGPSGSGGPCSPACSLFCWSWLPVHHISAHRL